MTFPETRIETHRFADDGVLPNNRLPLVVLRSALTPDPDDGAAAFERTFRDNGWTGTWRNGIYPFHHYHSTAHEVLGIARGSGEVQFGGEHGGILTVGTGDVVVVPAGVGHKRIGASDDFLVVGAYPEGQDWDLLRADPKDHGPAKDRIARVPWPGADPVHGADGPLLRLWRDT